MRMIVIMIALTVAAAWFVATHDQAQARGPIDGEALLVAVETGDIETLRTGIQRGANINGEIVGSTLLMRATQAGRADMVRQLMAMGANVNAQTEVGFNALMISVVCNKPEIREMLLEAGADPELRSRSGRNAFDMEREPFLIGQEVGDEEVIGDGSAT